MNKRKICVVTGTRAEYGLLYWLLNGIKDSNNLELQIIVTGMHLSTGFGHTYKEIENDGFRIDKKIDMLLSSDSSSAITKSTGLGMIGFADAYEELCPNIIILLGDRFEMLSAATAGLFAGIPIGHIHRGETTVGSLDESIRHSITKMAWWHFVAAEKYKNRVIQLGEDPNRVFLVGGMGVDCIRKSKLLDRVSLEKKLGFKFNKKNLLVTYHPETIEKQYSQKFFKALLDVLRKLDDTQIVFTYPNADSGNNIIKIMIEDFISSNQNSIAFKSMGHLNYLSTLSFMDAVIGNSSSGLIEAPTFKIATINATINPIN
ncbi:uncharacterized protein METZ01_LOCUS342820, partial [marine metagenome]